MLPGTASQGRKAVAKKACGKRGVLGKRKKVLHVRLHWDMWNRWDVTLEGKVNSSDEGKIQWFVVQWWAVLCGSQREVGIILSRRHDMFNQVVDGA